MSQYGDGTFRQRLLDLILDEIDDQKDAFSVMGETMTVVSHLVEQVCNYDAGLRQVRSQAKREAYNELMKKLNTPDS
jgi:hypothetical protein